MDLGEGRNMLTITELNIEEYGKLSSKFHYVYFTSKLKGNLKELSRCNKLKFLNPYFLATC